MMCGWREDEWEPTGARLWLARFAAGAILVAVVALGLAIAPLALGALWALLTAAVGSVF